MHPWVVWLNWLNVIPMHQKVRAYARIYGLEPRLSRRNAGGSQWYFISHQYFSFLFSLPLSLTFNLKILKKKQTQKTNADLGHVMEHRTLHCSFFTY